jgi:VanZ family protein
VNHSHFLFKGYVRFWLPVVLYALVIFSCSATPGQYVPELFPHGDKLLHFLEYLPFGLLIRRAFIKTSSSVERNSLLLTLLVVIFYALSDETHQLFVPDRQFDLLDAFFDTLGAWTGSLLYLWPKSNPF